jgi:sugar-specific transcriptional regulator TrmB
MYESELKELGLTDNEIKIYLALLEHGVLNPTQLAEKTGLHRSYVYDTVERLLDKGIINTVFVNNKKNYQVIDPKALREIFELKLRHIDTILPQLSELYRAVKEETRIELHKGKRVYRTLIKDLLANIKRNDTVYLQGVDENILDTVEPIYLKQYFNIIKEINVKEKIIIAKGGKKLKQANLEYRELEPRYLGDTTTVIYQSKVFIFIWGNPYYLIIIESKKVANTYLRQFELLWKIAKK